MTVRPLDAPPLVGRLRRFGLGRNPLRRTTDRVEGAAIAVAVLLALVMVPIALALGTKTFADRTEQLHAQQRDRVEVSATLLEPAVPTVSTSSGVAALVPARVAAGWHTPDGAYHTGMVEVTDTQPTGSQVTIWSDRAGAPVGRPISDGDVVSAAVCAALGSWLFVVLVLAAGVATLRLVLDRGRAAAWQREWLAVAPNWLH